MKDVLFDLCLNYSVICWRIHWCTSCFLQCFFSLIIHCLYQVWHIVIFVGSKPSPCTAFLTHIESSLRELSTYSDTSFVSSVSLYYSACSQTCSEPKSVNWNMLHFVVQATSPENKVQDRISSIFFILRQLMEPLIVRRDSYGVCRHWNIANVFRNAMIQIFQKVLFFICKIFLQWLRSYSKLTNMVD